MKVVWFDLEFDGSVTPLRIRVYALNFAFKSDAFGVLRNKAMCSRGLLFEFTDSQIRRDSISLQ